MFNRIFKNTFWLTSGEVIGRFLRIIIVLYSARLLGAADWGIFSYVLSLAVLFTIFTDIGISGVLTREIIKNPAEQHRYIATSFYLKVFLLLIGSLILIFATPFLSNIETSRSLLVLAALLVVFDSSRILFVSITRALEKMQWEALTNILTQTVILVLGLIALYKQPSAESLALAYVIGSAVGTMAILVLLKSYWSKIFATFDRTLVKKITSTAWPLALVGLLGAIMLNIDIIMLGWFKTATDIGYYSAAQKIIMTIYVLPAIVSSAVFPTFTRLAQANKQEEFRGLLEKTIKIVFLIALPLFIGGILIAPELVKVLYGPEYIPATGVFQILLVTLLFNYPVTIVGNALFAFERQKEFVKYSTLGIVGDIIFNFILIPPLGIAGAAISTVLTEIAMNIFIWKKMREIVRFEIFRKLPKIIISSIVMGILVLLLQSFNTNLLLIIIFAALIYFLSLYLLKEASIFYVIELVRSRWQKNQT